MDAANIPSFRALTRTAGVSQWSLRQLRGGAIAKMRLGELLKLSQALNISLEQLVTRFSPQPQAPLTPPRADLEQEYQHLQGRLAQQRQTLTAEFQAQALETIESWLVQWPTAAHAASQNSTVPAARLLPLMRPLETLMAQWDVVAIAPVGTVVSYDPQLHQLMDGEAQPGDPVRIRYAGYHHRDRLLHRARVSPAP